MPNYFSSFIVHIQPDRTKGFIFNALLMNLFTGYIVICLEFQSASFVKRYQAKDQLGIGCFQLPCYYFLIYHNFLKKYEWVNWNSKLSSTSPNH